MTQLGNDEFGVIVATHESTSLKYWTEEFVSSKAILHMVALLLATLLFFLYFQRQNETSVNDENSHYSKAPS